MATVGVPIKVKIGLRHNGHANHPDWRLLPLAKTDTIEDHQIVKWQYDNTSGHGDHSPHSPRGEQLGMMVVTRQFADEAMATFPGVVSEMTDAEAELFYEQRHTVHMHRDRFDVQHLTGLKVVYDLMVAVGAPQIELDAFKLNINRALDRVDPEPGVRRNRRKTWAGLKTELDLTVSS
jgi:hypothetical protein